MTDLLALTLQQPYATAIWPGPKRVENRPLPTVPLPLPRGGRWLALHAGKAWYPGGLEAVRRLWPECPHSQAMPLGSLLGVFHVHAIREYTTRDPGLYAFTELDRRLRDDPWAFGPWCLLIDDVRGLDRPIPCRGMLGCWRVPDAHVPALLALIPGGAP